MKECQSPGRAIRLLAIPILLAATAAGADPVPPDLLVGTWDRLHRYRFEPDAEEYVREGSSNLSCSAPVLDQSPPWREPIRAATLGR